MRRSLYISRRYDKDLIKYMEDNNFDKDFSLEVRKLMRDGIKYRKGGHNANVKTSPVCQSQSPHFKIVVGDKTLFQEVNEERNTSELGSKLDKS
jgi:hypothetical protein